MLRRDGRFHIDKAEIGFAEYLGDIREEAVPTAMIARGRVGGDRGNFGCCGRVDNRLVGNDVTCQGESDTADFPRIRGGRRLLLCGATWTADDQQRQNEYERESGRAGDGRPGSSKKAPTCVARDQDFSTPICRLTK
jgi:hypothetical protein